MLAELFTYLITSCPPHIRRMGYLHEVIAIRGRYGRNQAAWQEHLERSRAFILSSAKQCTNRRKVVILGAGLLLDVPLEALVSMFQQVVLVDIVFLPETRRQSKKYSNVVLIQHDVTNMADTLHHTVRQEIHELPQSVPRILDLAEDAGLVVSLNILSQLFAVPRAYVFKKMPSLDVNHIQPWCRQIVDAHFKALLSLRCNVCLITDHEFEERDRADRLVSRNSTLYDIPMPAPEASWRWDIAPRGEQDRHLSRSLSVGAWLFNNS
jgi:hypothetical protein